MSHLVGLMKNLRRKASVQSIAFQGQTLLVPAGRWKAGMTVIRMMRTRSALWLNGRMSVPSGLRFLMQKDVKNHALVRLVRRRF